LLLKVSALKFPMLMAEYLGTLRLAVFATAPSSRHVEEDDVAGK
jgi:hypothetical protein